jgi:hypothetical protein
MKPLVSVHHLAHLVGLTVAELREMAANVDDHYSRWTQVDEKKGKKRSLVAPDSRLKAVQRRILRRILADFPLPDCAHGGVTGRSPLTNASQHLGKDYLVNSDIRNFYPSITHHQVAAMFREHFGCGRDTTWLLTRLTTLDGCVPQGAPTSSMIANILLAEPVDQPLVEQADKERVSFTRFVDDVSLSGDHPQALINAIATGASKVGLRTHRQSGKLTITPRSRRQEVTGYTVNSESGPSVGRYKQARIRAAIGQLLYLRKDEFTAAVTSVDGRLNHLRQTNTGAAARLRCYLQRVLEERQRPR